MFYQISPHNSVDLHAIVSPAWEQQKTTKKQQRRGVFKLISPTERARS